MPGLFTLDVNFLAEVLDVNPATIRRNTEGAPFERANHGRKHWRPSDIVIGFRRPSRRGLSIGDLKELMAHDSEARAQAHLGGWDIFVGDQSTGGLHEVLTDRERARFADVRGVLRRGALIALWTDSVRIPDSVWDQALCAPPVLRYVLADDPAELPLDWAGAAVNFGLLHAPEAVAITHPHTTNFKEAA